MNAGPAVGLASRSGMNAGPAVGLASPSGCIQACNTWIATEGPLIKKAADLEQQ